MNQKIIRDIISIRLRLRPQVQELEVHSFFGSPNPFSNHQLNIRFGTNNRKCIQLVPFSRFGHGLVDEKRKLIIFTSPKCGSSTVKFFAEKSLGISREATETDRDYVQKGVWPVLTNSKSGLTRKNIKGGAILWNKYNEFRKVLIIRDPYERLVSFWLNKLFWLLPFYGGEKREQVLSLNPDVKLNHHHLYANTEDAELTTFADFINNLYRCFERGDTKLWDEHLSPQITADFKEIALANTELVTLNNLSTFLSGLVKKEAVVKINSTAKTNSRHFANAHLLTMKSVYLEKMKITKASFYNEELAEKIKVMYPTDWEVWQSVN